MRSRYVLITGVALLVTSLVGPAVQGAVSNDPPAWNWFGHMSESGHMWGGPGITDQDAPFSAAETITVLADDFSFTPEELTISASEPVNLRLVNKGRLPHDLASEELGLRIAAQPGDETVVGLEISEPGVYRIVCTYPGHAGQGMAGTLVVEQSR